MSTSDDRKVKRKKQKKGSVAKTHFQNQATCQNFAGSIDLSNSPTRDILSPGLDSETMKKLEKLMDAKDDSELPQILLSRGPNPYLERCLLCGCERKDSGQTEDFFNDLESSEKKSTDSNSLAQLPLWVCSDCRKSTDQGFDRKVNLDSFMDPDLPPEPAALPFLDPGLESEPSSPSGSVCNCEACTERRQIEEDHDRETQELQNCWTELRKLVRVLYGRREGDITHEEDDIPDEEKAKELVHRLCARDPHQLFLRLESQVREFVIEMKVKLLKQLNSGYKTPPEAKAFIQLLLDEYGHLCTVARKIAEILNKLKTDHLAKFNVTWELHNKHLFQSIAYTEPSIQSSLHLIISQLRLGAASKESYNEDTYPNLLHRYLKFDDEMSVISVVWRDSHQLIEQYNEEQAALKLKQKMLKEDWEFFKAQRKILEEQVSKNTKTPISHSFEAQFTETMRLMLQGSKPGPEECHCPRCNRKRCPCDECTITHMITCGLINTDALEACHNSKHPNFLHDPNRYRIDVSPPSMSSTTSSSGSSSPLMVDHERLTMPFDECQLGQNEDIPEEIEENCQSQNGKDEEEDEDDDDDIEDDEEDDDEDDDEEDDEDDDYDLDDGDDEDDEEEEEEDDLEDDLTDKIKLNEPQKSSQNIDTQSLPSDPDDDGAADLISSEKCDCYHCVSQAQAEQMIKLEENTCQCYACLREHGKTVSTSLPQQVTTETSRPAELNLYPHIHGSAGLHGLTNHHVRPLLPTQLYDLHLPIRQPKPLLQSPSKVPLKLDFDSPEGIHEHIYHAYGEWDNTYDARMLLPKYSNLGSELLPPAPLTSNFSTANFLSEPFSVATQTVGDTISTSTPTTSAFKTSISSHVSMTTVQVKEDVNKDNIVPKTKSSDVSNNTKNMSPPCTRPVTLGGNISQQKQTTSGGGVEKQHATHCKRHNPSLLGKNVINLQSHTHTENNSSNLPVKVTQDFIQTAARNIRENAKEGMQMIRQFANSLNANVNNSHSCNHSSRTTPNHLHQQNGSTDHNHASGCPNTMSLPTSVNNVSVGTTTGCLEQDFDGHYDDNCDSVDDSCSEQSSSASNSNQKEGKYCDCCYCEFFGHGNPPVAPTSKNYAEMRDRLRLRLKKKNEAKQEPHHHKENCIAINNHNNRLRDPVETQGLDELIKFINGTESKKEQEKSSKAAKRARQKQRKAEEKARLEAEKLRKEQEKAERERERALNAANKEKETKSARKKRKKEQEFISERQPDLNLIREPPAGKEDDRDTSAKNVKLKNNSTGKNSHSNSPQPVGKVKEESTGQRSAPKISQKNSLHCDSKENKHCTLPHNSSEVKKILSSPCNSPKFGKVKTNTEVAVKSSPVEKRKMCGDTVKEVPKSHTKVNIMDIVHDKILNEDADQLNKKSKKQQLSAGQKHFNNHLPSTPPQNQVQSAHRSQQQSSKLPPPPPPQSPRQQTLVQTKQPLPQQTSRQQQNQNIPRQQSPRQNISQSPRQQVSQLSVRQQATVNSRQPMPVSARQQQVKVQQPSSPRQPQLLKSQPSVNRQQQLQFKDLPVQQNGTPVDPPIPKYTQNITQNGTTDVFKQPGPVNKVEKSTPEDKKSGKVKKPDDTSPQEQVKSNRNKKNKKKNRNSEDLSVIDEIFMPKSESDLENGEMDEVEKELEEFKRFCLDSTPVKREKLQVNMNLKDIFVKKKSGLGCS